MPFKHHSEYHREMRCLRCLPALASVFFSTAVLAADDVVPGTAVTDPPTVVTLGVFWPFAGDDDGDATGTVRFRAAGSSDWREGLELHRVRPDVVSGLAVAQGFGGSLFGLTPGTDWEIELTITDPDGGGAVQTLTASTRVVPGDPSSPTVVTVDSAAGLSAALQSAEPGDVIELMAGLYTGPFSINASGTAADPIVVRGPAGGGAILDGGLCTDCNVLEVYGSFTHLESLTFRNANRALRFQGEGTEGNAVRYTRTENTNLGFGGRDDQRNFYICDNDLDGPLSWPNVYTDDGGANANVDGIVVFGTGHVVCHNRLSGWGDALKIGQDGGSSIDFYGNDVLSAYDNALEFDSALRNVRGFRNRFTNSYAPISFQPVFGGPVYAIRNVVVNVAHEQLKFHSLGGTQETSGIYVLNNTFVSPARALTLSDSTTSHHFTLSNNLFIGGDPPENGRTVEWTGGIDNGVFDFNGYHPDGAFNFEDAGDWPSFAAMQGAGLYEVNGLLVGASPFASGLVPPGDYTQTIVPSTVELADGSAALDVGRLLANVNDGFDGSAPDLGAVEKGCAEPTYGPRPGGLDDNDFDDCGAQGGGSGSGGSGPGGGGSGEGGAGASAGGAGPGPGPGSGGAAAADGDAGEGCGCDVAPRSVPVNSLLGLFGLAFLVGVRRARRTHRTAHARP